MTRLAPAATESDHFGVRIGRARIDADDVDELLAEAQAQDLELLVVRCDVADARSARRLASGGFDLMDTIVHYAYDLERRPVPEPTSAATIRPAAPSDADAVEAIAQVAFRDHHGHFQEDERLDAAARSTLYPMWARASCLAADDPDELVVVAEDAGRVVGFITGRASEGRDPVGLLAGVLPEHRRGGVYRALLARRLAAFRDRGAGRTVVSTQLAHLPSQRAWVEIGYEPAGAEHTFHRWLDR